MEKSSTGNVEIIYDTKLEMLSESVHYSSVDLVREINKLRKEINKLKK